MKLCRSLPGFHGHQIGIKSQMLAKQVPCLQYVDDTTLLASNKKEANELLRIYNNFCSKYRINLNWEKCSVTCFRQNCQKNPLRKKRVEGAWEVWKGRIKQLRKERANTRQKTSRALVRKQSIQKNLVATEREIEPYTTIEGGHIMGADSMKPLGVNYHWALSQESAKKSAGT